MKIKNYLNGNEFITDNKDYLSNYSYETAFFFLDAKLFKEVDKNNYALKIEDGFKRLVVLKVKEYNTMFFGSSELVEPLLDYIMFNGYNLENFFALDDISKEVDRVMKNKYNIEFYNKLSMDFMESTNITAPSDPKVDTINNSDVDIVYNYLKEFLVECNISDPLKRETVVQDLLCYRVLRVNGKIVAIAKLEENDSKSLRISYVYTDKLERNKGYARRLVTTMRNETINKNMNCVLNVDKLNPISNHLYESIGFKRLFSHSVYNLKK